MAIYDEQTQGVSVCVSQERKLFEASRFILQTKEKSKVCLVFCIYLCLCMKEGDLDENNFSFLQVGNKIDILETYAECLIPDSRTLCCRVPTLNFDRSRHPSSHHPG